MTIQTVNVALPRAVYRRLERLAATMHLPIEQMLAQTINGNLPPALEDAPVALRAELASWFDLSDEDLWAIARRAFDARVWKEHQRLLRKNTEGDLTPRERENLERLRTQADQYVARKSFALALLKWRGYALPTATDEGKRGAA